MRKVDVMNINKGEYLVIIESEREYELLGKKDILIFVIDIRSMLI